MAERNLLVDLVKQLQTVESMLIAGATVYTMAEELAVSTRQVRRMLNHLRELGVVVQSSYIPGNREAAVMTAKKSTRLFRRVDN